MKILLVEDCPCQRAIYLRFLMDHGHEVTEAKDGVEALLLIEATPDHWEVLISDYNMPKMDGAELILETVRKNISPHRIILFSGTVSDNPIVESLSQKIRNRGWFQFVNKDEGIEKLNSTLEARE